VPSWGARGLQFKFILTYYEITWSKLFPLNVGDTTKVISSESRKKIKHGPLNFTSEEPS